ncbi:hypothetical protein X798_02801 [Onchocerca flexuosa]|uniref:Uncharacterized protein n=1 Tax=Onchocerca flexuosa TaxID=387005 RepID=A0A238BY75_9BILA|nr:hypothetical protein X798_02801 [Onchocerca flexuosa]
MVLTLWKQSSPLLLSALLLICFPICNHATLLTHIVRGRSFDVDPLSIVGRELKVIQPEKQRSSNNLRNCFFSPVQCLLPFDSSRSMENDIKKRIEFFY